MGKCVVGVHAVHDVDWVCEVGDGLIVYFFEAGLAFRGVLAIPDVEAVGDCVKSGAVVLWCVD